MRRIIGADALQGGQETLASRLTHALPTLAGMVEPVSHSTHSMCANAWKVFTERPANRTSMSANRIRAKMEEPVLTALDHSPVSAGVVSLAISARTHMCHAILRRAKMGAPAGRPTTSLMIAPACQDFQVRTVRRTLTIVLDTTARMEAPVWMA